MRVLRGRLPDPTADRERTAAMLSRAAETGEGSLRVFAPKRQLAFGRRDARSDGYEAARAAAREHGFPPYERDVGGRAVAYTGTTVAFARAIPLEDMRRGMGERYEGATTAIEHALADLGVAVERGEPPEAFCPGQHSLSTDGGKVVGIAQRVRKGAAMVSGVVVVDGEAAIAAVLEDVYDALGVPFDPASVGSVAAAGGPGEPGAMVDAVETALLADHEGPVERIDLGG